MKRFGFAAVVLGVAMSATMGCQTSPPTDEGKAELHDKGQDALKVMYNTDPSFREFVRTGHAYVVFPTIGEGGLIVGGGRGRGEVYRGDEMLGYAQVTFATVGLQAGGQAFSEVIVFENSAALDKFVNNKFEFTAKASAVALKEGAARSAKYTDGVAIFIHTKGGLMAQAAIGGQKFSFTPSKL